ncbi:MAG: MlaD family protein [Pseudomonadota bacterium]
METRANYVFIGTVVLVVMAVAAIFVLVQSQGSVSYDRYEIVFADRVSGLSRGSPVRFNGIQKGDVQELIIDKDDPELVIARIRVESDTPVKTDTKAELELVGFTGLAVIQLVGGTAEAELLKDISRGMPRIEADTSGFAAFLSGSGEIVTAANRLLSEENTDAFGSILANLDTTTKAVAENDAAIRETVENAAKLTRNLADASDQLSAVAENLEALTSEDAVETFDEAQRALQDLRKLTASLQAIVDDNREPVSLFAEQGLTQVGPALAELRRTFRTLDQVLREVDRDPRGYLFGESTPRHNGDKEDAVR